MQFYVLKSIITKLAASMHGHSYELHCLHTLATYIMNITLFLIYILLFKYGPSLNKPSTYKIVISRGWVVNFMVKNLMMMITIKNDHYSYNCMHAGVHTSIACLFAMQCNTLLHTLRIRQ